MPGSVTQWITNHTDLSPEMQMRIFESLLVVLGLCVIRLLVVALVNRRTQDVRVRYHWNKMVGYLCSIVGFVWLGRLWLMGFQSVFTMLGLVAAGLTIVLKDVIVNLAGWAFLVTRRPFNVGDRVQIAGVTGDVVDIGLFQFAMLEVGGWVDADQSTGRLVSVPNAFVFTNLLTSYTRGFPYIWNEIPVTLEPGSDWRKAKEVLTRIVHEQGDAITKEVETAIQAAANDYMIHYSVLTPAVYMKVDDGTIQLTLRYLCHPRRRRDTEEALWEAILTATDEDPSLRLKGLAEIGTGTNFSRD